MKTTSRLHDIIGARGASASSLTPGELCFDGVTLALRALSNDHLVTIPLANDNALVIDQSLEAIGVIAFPRSLRLRAVPLSSGFDRRSRPARIHGALLLIEDTLALACSFSSAAQDSAFGAGALTLAGQVFPHRDGFSLGFDAWRLEWLNEHGEVVIELERGAGE